MADLAVVCAQTLDLAVEYIIDLNVFGREPNACRKACDNFRVELIQPFEPDVLGRYGEPGSVRSATAARRVWRWSTWPPMAKGM
jgi:hypothetical protein